MFVLLVGASFAIAQDATPEASCSPAEFKEALTNGLSSLQEQVTTLQTEEDILAFLLGMETSIDGLRATCVDTSFSSENYPNGIIGPIRFTGTLYEVTFTIEEGGLGYATGVTVEGDCPSSFLISPSSNESSETDLMRLRGECFYMFEVNTSTEWTLDIVRIR
jgi:hypothetical protein